MMPASKYEISRTIKKIIPTWIQRELVYKLKISTGVQKEIIDKIDELNCIFIHVPKCAGIAIQKGLFGGRIFGHQTIRQYQIALKKDVFDSAWKFTIVRNPWERAVSAWTFMKSGGYDELDRKFYEENLSQYRTFDIFIKEWLIHQDIKTCSCIHFRPQVNYLESLDGKIKMDFIARFENIRNDYSFIREKIDGNELQIHNKTIRDKINWTQFYSDERSKGIVGKLYSKDIRVFGYDFPD